MHGSSMLHHESLHGLCLIIVEACFILYQIIVAIARDIFMVLSVHELSV
jgi:hypothetical protein